MRTTPEGIAAALSVAPVKSDLGKPASWTGGFVTVKPATLEIARGRTEITLTASAPPSLAPGLLSSEIALGKVLISRARF